MTQRLSYRFTFRRGAELPEAELTLLLASAAAEGVHGECAVRADVSWRVEPAELSIVVDAGTPSGLTTARVFTALLARELGRDGFSVRRVERPAGAAA